MQLCHVSVHSFAICLSTSCVSNHLLHQNPSCSLFHSSLILFFSSLSLMANIRFTFPMANINATFQWQTSEPLKSIFSRQLTPFPQQFLIPWQTRRIIQRPELKSTFDSLPTAIPNPMANSPWIIQRADLKSTFDSLPMANSLDNATSPLESFSCCALISHTKSIFIAVAACFSTTGQRVFRKWSMFGGVRIVLDYVRSWGLSGFDDNDECSIGL
ncbi:unnamed protein product [Amaranthus hypochondriacus]